MTYGKKSTCSIDSISVSNDFVSCDNNDKSSEIKSNDYVVCVSSVKSSEPMTAESSSNASTSSVSTHASEANLESSEGTTIQEPIIVQELPSFSCTDKDVKTSRTPCNKNGYFNKKTQYVNDFHGWDILKGNQFGTMLLGSLSQINLSHTQYFSGLARLDTQTPESSILHINVPSYDLAPLSSLSCIGNIVFDQLKFKNAKLIELCGEKGIKRDYSNARTPQQNGVAERRNRTLIEAARTIDHLGKFDGEGLDEGYLVGYSTSNRAYRSGPYDLDYLTNSLGYNRDKANQSAGTQDVSSNPACFQDDDSDSDSDEQFILVPGAESKDTSDAHSNGVLVDTAEDIFQEELARLKDQEQRATSDAERLGLGFAKDARNINEGGQVQK
ncbi:putative ribonuclease H-like domain-containing protein [Tanacetum coccineum]